MAASVCLKVLTIPEAAIDICGLTPQSIQAAIWTQSVVEGQPPCDNVSIVAGLGTWDMTFNLTTCIDAGMRIDSEICNPGAPYLITVTVPWDDSGNVDGFFMHLWSIALEIGGVGVSNDSRDLVTGPFTPLVCTGTIPTGISTLALNFAILAVPDPEVEIHNLGNLTITPLLPPP
jgi:hypothetical protein